MSLTNSTETAPSGQTRSDVIDAGAIADIALRRARPLAEIRARLAAADEKV